MKKKYTIKKRNIIRLEKYLKKLENGRNKDQRPNGKEC
jgi:hypothetical protein